MTVRHAYSVPKKTDFIMTGRRVTTKGIDFLLGDSEYADDTAVLFNTRQELEMYTPLHRSCG